MFRRLGIRRGIPAFSASRRQRGLDQPVGFVKPERYLGPPGNDFQRAKRGDCKRVSDLYSPTRTPGEFVM